jgi:hypothetical protein
MKDESYKRVIGESKEDILYQINNFVSNYTTKLNVIKKLIKFNHQLPFIEQKTNTELETSIEIIKNLYSIDISYFSINGTKFYYDDFKDFSPTILTHIEYNKMLNQYIIEYKESELDSVQCIPVVAENKEEIFSIMETIILKCLSEHAERSSVWDNLHKKYNNMKSMDFYRERNELAAKYPWYEPIFTSGNNSINLKSYINLENGNYGFPEVYTIDEWFEEYGHSL